VAEIAKNPRASFKRGIVDCTEVMERLSDYLDVDVRAELRKAVDEHLSACRDCSFYVDTVRKTVVLYQADLRMEVPMKATARLHAALAAEYAMHPRKRPGPTD
jgi:predicted anti-sigma-YlaC factor YlaD